MISAVQSIWRSVKRQTQSQRYRSQYANENWRQRALRVFWAAAYLCYGLFIGVTFLRREVLGEIVIYRGRRCAVWNWANSESPTLSTLQGPKETLKYCSRKEIRTFRTPSTYVFRFAGGFVWWVDNWFSIAVDRRLYPAAFADQCEVRR